MLPYEKSPLPHFSSEKSSVSASGRVGLAFELALFALTVFALRFVRVFVFLLATLLLLFESESMPKSASSITDKPTTRTAATSIPPSTHQIALDFFGGGIVG